jgi:hypothetical protein
MKVHLRDIIFKYCALKRRIVVSIMLVFEYIVARIFLNFCLAEENSVTGSALSGTMVIMDTTRFFPRTIMARFRNRPNRFIVECATQNRPVQAYLPNSGRLWELFFPGSVLRPVRHAASHGGSTDYTVVAVERDGIPIMLHTHVNNFWPDG